MQAFIIAPIAEEHIQSYHAVLDCVARERKYLSSINAPPLASTQAFVLGNIKDNWPHVVAIIEDKVVGWCDITSIGIPISTHTGVLGMGVLESFRGLGIGKKMMQTTIEMARSRGLKRIELSVFESNKPAIALYQNLGFQVEGVHINSIFLDNKYENHFSMALLFD